MDWSQSIRILQAQGPVFWAAAVAVAAGFTLLAVAGAMQWRRRRTPQAVRAPRVRATATGYTAQPDPTAPAALAPSAAPAATADPRLPELGQRLAAAAARLEAIRSDRALSGLKHPSAEVEYLHRRGRA